MNEPAKLEKDDQNSGADGGIHQYLFGVLTNEFPNELPARIEEAIAAAAKEAAPSNDQLKIGEIARTKLA
jgi:hypothetical protein